MSKPQVFQGTWSELSALAETFGRKLLTVVVPSEDSLEGTAPSPPEVVETKERLEELLLEGLASPSRPLTAEVWQELESRVRRRAAGSKR